MKALQLALVVALGLSVSARAEDEFNPTTTKEKEHQELKEKLTRNIFKVKRAISETEKLISKSRNAPYLPDLQFRLAELYVEESRYQYYFDAESRPPEMKGAVVSPSTKLLKEKAVQIYYRLLREHPDFKDGDKVTFYLAHEQRELGLFDEMLKTEGELIRKYPDSPLRLDAEQILGDYFFDKADLVEAEKHYQAILDAPPSPVHDLARYKMGWIRINQNKHAEAVTYFEAAAASAPLPGVDPQKSLNVKREALLDLVYSYTEARPPKGAINYFEKLSDSRATFALALDKLGNRYFIKQQYEFAIPALRKLLEIVSDPEMDLERAEKIYDSIKAAKGKVVPEPEDIKFLVRAAVQVKTDPLKDETERKKTLAELEEMGRDLATSLHGMAQKKDDQKMYEKSAEAYAEYLSLFRPEKYVRVMMRNRADALFAAKDFPKAARQFEELAELIDSKADGKDAAPKKDVVASKGPSTPGAASGDDDDGGTYESALYGAMLSHFTALKRENVTGLDAFEVSDARQALKLLGAEYISRFPQSDKATEVKFNIARAYYDDGEYEKSAELFTAFALAYPSNKDATVAGHLALDSYRQIPDYDGLQAAGKKFAASSLPGTFIAEVKEITDESKKDEFGEKLLQNMQESSGDLVESMSKLAEANKGTSVGEQAAYGAFGAARDKHDLQKEIDLGHKFVTDYPKSQYVTPVMLALGRDAALASRFGDAANFYEELGQKLGTDASALDGWLNAARLRMQMADYAGAVKALEKASDVSGARKSEVLTLLASTWMKAKEPGKARAAAEQALALNKLSAEAGAIVAEVASNSNPSEKETQELGARLVAIAQGPDGQSEDTARAIWYLADITYRQFKALPADKVEEKVGYLQQLEGLYTQAASMGSPEYAVASLWRLGTAYQHLADTVEATPPPEGASAAEIQQFRTAVKEQVAPIKQRAETAFTACLSRAESLEVFSPAVLGCRNRTDAAKSPIQPVSAKPLPPNMEELQRKAEQVMDAPSMEALGMAYLEARQLPLAQLTLERTTEIEDAGASAMNALGVAQLLAGDAMAARASYGKALESDPTYEKARVNLAALKCRYGDTEGARRELAVIKDTGNLGGPDVDPEWRTCK